MSHRVETFGRNALRAGLLVGVAAALIGGHALAATDNPSTPCFFITQWQGWKAPNPNTIYLGVNLHDVYRVDLSAGSPQLMWPAVHLLSEVRGSNSICSAIDLQLYVVEDNAAGFRNGVGSGINGFNFASGSGFRVPLIARKLTKLTPEEIAAIPKQYRPN
jgi:hypothetical protein